MKARIVMKSGGTNMNKRIEVNKKSDTYQEYETVAGNAEVLRNAVRKMTGEEISLGLRCQSRKSETF